MWIQLLQELTVTSHCPRLALVQQDTSKTNTDIQSVCACDPELSRIHRVNEIAHQLWLILLVLEINFEVLLVFKSCIALWP